MSYQYRSPSRYPDCKPQARSPKSETGLYHTAPESYGYSQATGQKSTAPHYCDSPSQHHPKDGQTAPASAPYPYDT